MSSWIIKQTGGAGGGAPAVPGNPTLGTPSYREIYPESDGKAYADVTIPVTPPSPLGAYQGAWAWLDKPDSYEAAELDSLEMGSDEMKGPWSPELVGWVSSGEALRFRSPLPSTAEGGQFWRVYVAPGSQQVEQKPIRKGGAGESPSVSFKVDPPQEYAIGREYAPLAENLSATIEHDPGSGNDAGIPRWRFKATVKLPLNDENFSTLGGVDIVLFDNDPTTEDLQDSVSVEAGKSEAEYVGEWRPYPYPPIDYRLSAISFSTDGRRNSFAYGVTPSSILRPMRPAGAAGVEYAGNVTLGSWTSSKVSNSDGSVEHEFTVPFTVPSSDPRFGGVVVWASEGGGPAKRVPAGSRLSPMTFSYRSPANPTPVRFYFPSVNRLNEENSIQIGVTPFLEATLGTTAGELNLARASNSSFTSRLRLNGGQFDINVNAISTEFLAAAGIDVGGGGSKPARFRVFDQLGALIGWIGDDTANSGFVGAWLKQCRIGGSLPSNAPLVADANGNVSLNGATMTLNLNGITTSLNHQTVYSNVAALRTIEGSGMLREVVIAPNLIGMYQNGNSQVEVRNGSPGSPAGVGGQILVRNFAGGQCALLNGYSNQSQFTNVTVDAPNTLQLNGPVLRIDFASAALAGGTVPTTCAGYIPVTVNGSSYKVPYFS